MMKLSRVLGAAIVGAMFASASSAQLVVGPGDQTLTVGSETNEFVFEMTGAANNAALFGFVINYDPATAPYEPVADQDGNVTCTVESDLGAFSPLVFFFPDRTPTGQFRVSFGDQTFPLASLPRDGVYLRCPVTLKEGAAAGTSDLTCSTTPGATSATNNQSAPIEVTCEDGTLTIAEASPTPTATDTPEPPTPTDTPEVPTSTPTNTPRIGGGGQDDDGCQMVAPADASMGWIFLAPAALLIWRRRRAL